MAPSYLTGFWSLTVIWRYGRRLAKCHRKELSTRCRPSGSRISADFVTDIILLTSNKNLNYFAFPSRQKGLENNASISSRDFPCINSVYIHYYKDNHFIELNTWPHTGCFITVLTANLQWDNKILGLMNLSLGKDT